MWPSQRKPPMTAKQARAMTKKWKRFWEPWEKWKADRKESEAFRRALANIRYAAFVGERQVFVPWQAGEALVKLGYTVRDNGSADIEVRW